MESLSNRANVLIEALPYIRRYHGKTMVIKYGGSAMENGELKRAVMTDVVLLHYVGIKPIVVHGGGSEISQLMKRLGKESRFVDGLRVTDAETMRFTEMVLVGQIGKEIVHLIQQQGGRAVGLSGKDGGLLVAEKFTPESGADLGFVGDVVEVNAHILNVMTDNAYIPVVSTTAMGRNGETFNINADLAAGKVAAAVGACKLIMLTDVRGVYRALSDETSLLSTLTAPQVREMLGGVESGMIPKLQACLEAVAGGVERAHIIDGRQPHAVLMEVFTDEGIGTMIVPSGGTA